MPSDDNRTSKHVECGSKSNTGNKRYNWDHFIITHTVPEQHTEKARNSLNTDNSHFGHCTHTAGSANVKVQNKIQGRNNTTGSINCKYKTAATLYTL